MKKLWLICIIFSILSLNCLGGKNTNKPDWINNSFFETELHTYFISIGTSENGNVKEAYKVASNSMINSIVKSMDLQIEPNPVPEVDAAILSYTTKLERIINNSDIKNYGFRIKESFQEMSVEG